MRLRPRYMVIAISVLGLSVSCANSVAAAPHKLVAGFGATAPLSGPATPQIKIFVAQADSNVILELDSQGRHIGQLNARYPNSFIAVDGAGNLYVSANAKENNIQIFRAPDYRHVDTFPLPAGAPAEGVAVDVRSGLLAVFTVHVRSQTETLFFRKGEQRACRVVQQQPNSYVFGGYGTFDRRGNLFANVGGSNGEFILEVDGGCRPGAVRATTFANPFHPSVGYGFDSNDQFIVQASIAYNNQPIYKFKHSVNGTFGMPIETTTLPEYQGFLPTLLRLSSDGVHIIAGGYKDVAEYSYPSGQPTWIDGGVQGFNSAVVVPAVVPCAMPKTTL